MLQEYKQPWIGALRSNSYYQTKGQLKRSNNNSPSYCCLGVLAVVCGLEITADTIKDDKPDEFFNYPLLAKKAGITSEDEDIFINMNDNENQSFDEIADYIEDNL